MLLVGEHTLFRNQFPISAQKIKNEMAYCTIANYRLSGSEPITYTLCLSPGTHLIARPPFLSSSLSTCRFYLQISIKPFFGAIILESIDPLLSVTPIPLL